MYESDQRHRAQMAEAFKKHGLDSPETQAAIEQQEAIDAANLKRLEQIVERDGWPKISVVGSKAALAAFLVVQHASSLDVQKKYLPLMQAAANENEAQPANLALLEDRILVREGKKQKYGSQMRRDSEGGSEFYPIADEANVDARRKEVGLPPLAEYARRNGFEYRPPEPSSDTAASSVSVESKREHENL